MAAQNIYDNPDFFAGYSQMRRVQGGLNEAMEWPAFKRLLPKSIMGLRVLDLGCGMGHFARAAREMGAAEVIGVDVSERMLAEARARTNDPAITYHRAEIEGFDGGDTAFDLVTSSLALHYIADYRGVAVRLARALKPGGRVVFSVEHPVMTSLAAQAWHRAPDGAKLHWPIDNYCEEGPRATHWFVDGVIKYHRTIETYVQGLLDAGLVLAGLLEPVPEAEFLGTRPDLVEEYRRPPFMLLAADKR